MSNGDENIIDLTDPTFQAESTIQPMWSNLQYNVQFFPHSVIRFYYLKLKDHHLDPVMLDSLNNSKLIIINLIEFENNQKFFFFSLTNEQYSFLIKVYKNFMDEITIFLKKIQKTVFIFNNKKVKSTFNKLFHISLIEAKFSDQSTKNFFNYAKKSPYPENEQFYHCFLNHKIQTRHNKIHLTIMDAISMIVKSNCLFFLRSPCFSCHQNESKKLTTIFDIDSFVFLNEIVSTTDYSIISSFHRQEKKLYILKCYKNENIYQNDYKIFRENVIVTPLKFVGIVENFGHFPDFETNQVRNNHVENWKMNHEICKNNATDRVVVSINDKYFDDVYFCLTFEYKYLTLLNDPKIPVKSLEKCLLEILYFIDYFHRNNYILNNISLSAILYSIDNKSFFHDFSGLEKTDQNYIHDLQNFGDFIKLLKIKNPILNEIVDCFNPHNNFKAYPFPPYFIYKLTGKLTFDMRRNDTLRLLLKRTESDLSACKTLIFCFSALDRSIDEIVKQLPDDWKYNIGQELLKYSPHNGLTILNQLTEVSGLNINVFYALAKFYFYIGEFHKAFDTIVKIQTPNLLPKLNYIKGRLYQKHLIHKSEKNETQNINTNRDNSKNFVNSDKQFANSYFMAKSNLFWRNKYRLGNNQMESYNFDDAIKIYLGKNDQQINQAKEEEGKEEEDNFDDEDRAFFNDLGDNSRFIKGMIKYRLGICYLKKKSKEAAIYLLDSLKYNNVFAYAPLALYLFNIKNPKSFDFAEKYLFEAIKYAPHNIDFTMKCCDFIFQSYLKYDLINRAYEILELELKLLHMFSLKISEITKIYQSIKQNSFDLGVVCDKVADDKMTFISHASGAACGSSKCFYELYKCYLFGKGVRKDLIKSIVCLEASVIFSHYIENYYESNHNNVKEENNQNYMMKDKPKIFDDIQNYLDVFPREIIRKAYIDLGTLLFKISNNKTIYICFILESAKFK